MAFCTKISGIYKIQSKKYPQRIYIGSSVNIYLRWLRHLSELKRNIHHSPKLQNHYNKYGKTDLQFSILIGCEKNDLLNTEQYFINTNNPYFNICKIAGSSLGLKRTKETKLRCSDAQLKRSREHSFKIGRSRKRKIYQYGKKGNFMKEWESSWDASRTMGIHRNSISNCLTGRSEFAGGYIWKYKIA